MQLKREAKLSTIIGLTTVHAQNIFCNISRTSDNHFELFWKISFA